MDSDHRLRANDLAVVDNVDAQRWLELLGVDHRNLVDILALGS